MKRREVFAAALLCGWIGASISVVGDAFLEYVFVVTAAHQRNGISIGVLGMVIGLPTLLGGWVGARLDLRRDKWALYLIGSLIGSALACCGLIAVLRTGAFAVTAYITVFLLGAFGLVTTTLWQASIPYFVREDRDAIKRVMGWTATTFTAGAAIGPIAASLLVRYSGTARLMIWDAVSFVLCAGLLIPVARALRAGIALVEEPKMQVRPDWLAGIRKIMSEPLVRLPAITLAVMNFVTYGVAFALPVLVVRRHLPDYLIAWISAAFVVGTMIGSIFATRFRHDRHFAAYLTSEPLLRGLGLLLVALSSSVVGLLLGTLLFTVPQGMGRVARAGIMMTCFPGAQRAKIVGSYQMLVRSLMSAAPLAMQGLVATVGIIGFFLLAALTLTALSAVVASDRTMRRLRHREVSLAGVVSSPIGESKI